MSKRRTRPIFFVCSAIFNNKLLSEIIQVSALEEAVKSFKDKYQIDPESVFGPFYKKRTQALENTTNIVYSTAPPKKAEYNGWLVNANILKKPENHAMIIFNKRLDGKNLPTPQGITVVPIYDLRFT